MERNKEQINRCPKSIPIISIINNVSILYLFTTSKRNFTFFGYAGRLHEFIKFENLYG